MTEQTQSPSHEKVELPDGADLEYVSPAESVEKYTAFLAAKHDLYQASELYDRATQRGATEAQIATLAQMESQLNMQYQQLIATMSWDGLHLQQVVPMINDMLAVFGKYQNRRALVPHMQESPNWAPSVLEQVVPRQWLRLAYLHNDCRLAQAIESGAFDEFVPEFSASLLAKSYGPKLFDLEPGDDSVVDRVVERMGDFGWAKLMAEAVPDLPSDNWSDRYAHDKDCSRITKEVFRRSGLSADLAQQFELANWARWSMAKVGTSGAPVVDKVRIKASLRDTIAITEQCGAETITMLFEKIGLVNIDQYNASNVADLVAIVNNDKGALEDLRSHNVTVVMTDAMGDYNGAFYRYHEQFEAAGARVLRLEVRRAGDILRRMALLKNRTIAPSVFVLGAHGLPGSIGFGGAYTAAGGAEPFTLIPDDSGRETYAPFGAVVDLSRVNLKRLFGEGNRSDFMQPIREYEGVPPELVGRKEIIISSCSSDVGYAGAASVAEQIARGIGSQHVDVYGAGDVMAPIEHEDGGLYFARAERNADGSLSGRVAGNVTQHLMVEPAERVVRQPVQRLPIVPAARKKAA